MTNVVPFRPVPGKSRRHSDIRQMERNRLYVKRQLEQQRSWWGRFRRNCLNLFQEIRSA